MDATDKKAQITDMSISNNCENCSYFFSCQIEVDDMHEYCKINPEALGYCELWSGPIVNFNICHGWADR
jgi:hypothetical protein